MFFSCFSFSAARTALQSYQSTLQGINQPRGRGRVAGPFPQSPLPSLHVSHFGVIPRCNQPGKWHLILDLSSPVGHGVNDGIAGKDYSLQYMKADLIIAGIMQFGWGSLVAKFDVQNAYHIVPVHPKDRRLLGMKWRGAFQVDMVLPFGVRSAPYLFFS